ncbi:MAG: SpoIIE family protein phosphatase, partial [Clostridia bacterium]
MALYLESGFTSLNKCGEELCGDKVEISVNGDYTTVVLADGLGSGVKANILATLTSKILCTMVSNGVDMEDCIETMIQTLPVCRERNVAYATFSVVHVNSLGEGTLIEFDNPEAIYITDGKCTNLERKEYVICGKKVYESALKLKANDCILVLSDGVIHAGIGILLNLGWQRKDVMEYLNRNINADMSARAIACLLAGACNDLYIDKPGDDTTVAAIKIREKVAVSLMVGPPVDKSKDDFYLAQFLDGDGKKIVCGGTSSQLVARYLGEQIKTSFDAPDKDVPPIGYIKGIDLTTEGVLTLRKLLELSEKYLSSTDLTPKYFKNHDGASLLAKILFEEATNI